MYNVCVVPVCLMLWSYFVILCSLVCMCVWYTGVSCSIKSMIVAAFACMGILYVCGMHVWCAGHVGVFVWHACVVCGKDIM